MMRVETQNSWPEYARWPISGNNQNAKNLVLNRKKKIWCLRLWYTGQKTGIEGEKIEEKIHLNEAQSKAY